jgi:hypothetical protein
VYVNSGILTVYTTTNQPIPTNPVVWNIKSQQARLVQLTPSDSWGGAGLLGVTIRLDNYAGAEDRLVRVLTVEPQSPAAVAGLVPEKDFLLGTTHQTFDSTSALATILYQHRDEVVEMYVYNTDSDMVRVVALMPTLTWGGAGLLGAEVGTGYLHRLPSAVRSTEGSSVERKVRYVGQGPPSSPRGKGSPTKNRLILEVEPQLEMEPELEMEASEHDDDDSVEEVYPSPVRGSSRNEKEPQRAEKTTAPQKEPPVEETSERLPEDEERRPTNDEDQKTPGLPLKSPPPPQETPTNESTTTTSDTIKEETSTSIASKPTTATESQNPPAAPIPTAATSAVSEKPEATTKTTATRTTPTSSPLTRKTTSTRTTPTSSPFVPPPPKMHYNDSIPKLPQV